MKRDMFAVCDILLCGGGNIPYIWKPMKCYISIVLSRILQPDSSVDIAVITSSEPSVSPEVSSVT